MKNVLFPLAIARTCAILKLRKIRNVRIEQGLNMTKKTYTTFDISEILDVYPSTVADWIDSGTLRGFTTPGGHRRVQKSDLLTFLQEHGMPVPDELQENSRPEILIVDDDDMVLSALSQYISRTLPGTGVLTASDGFEAGQLVTMHRPAIVILDIMLPGLNGFRVCELIKKQYPEMKVIAISGYGTRENEERMIQAGADAFFAKPVEMDDLRQSINGLLCLIQAG
jgi:excisionase family DNA binding protein